MAGNVPGTDRDATSTEGTTLQPDYDMVPPTGYRRVPIPVNAPPAAPEPINGEVGARRPAPHPAGAGPWATGRVLRWLFEHGIAEPEPARVDVDRARRLVMVTLDEPVHVVAWADRFDAARPARLPTDPHLGQGLVQAEIARHGWVIVFRHVEAAR